MNRSNESRPGEVPRLFALTASYSWRFLVVLAAVCVFVYALVTLRLIFIPVVVALLISTLLVPLAERLRKRGLPSLLATWIVIAGALGLVAGIVSLIAPAIAGELDNLGRDVRKGTEDVITWLTEGPLDLTRAQIDGYVDQLSEQLSAQRSSIVSGAFKGAYLLVEVVVGALLTLVLTFFFVKDGNRLATAILGLFPERRHDDIRTVSKRSWDALGAYIRGTAIVGLVDAVAIGGTMLVLGVPLVGPIAVITFFGAFFPLVGAVVAGVIAALVALVTTGFLPALILAAATIVVQQVEGDVLQPLVLGRAVHLHPLVILLSLTTGAIVAGIAGAFLAVPVAAVAAVVVAHLRGRDPGTVAEAED
ncbi:MAG TPA: AI-2E family transporter [Actinomycetota bacterium]|nr:AI-2E family transporter [Actinomycetota bacterium]